MKSTRIVGAAALLAAFLLPVRAQPPDPHAAPTLEHVLGTAGQGEQDFPKGVPTESGYRKLNILNMVGSKAFRLGNNSYVDRRSWQVRFDERIDAMVIQAHRHGQTNVQMLFEYYPNHGPLGDYQVWHDIGRAYAQRYAPDSEFLRLRGIRGWGIGCFAAINEPDHLKQIDRNAYAQALRGLADGVHSVAPQVHVIPGGFMSINASDSATLEGYGTALADLLNNGTLDGIDLHTYNGFWAPLGDYANSAQANFDAVKKACGITRDIAFYATEFNYQQSSAEGQTQPVAITQDRAAEYFLTCIWDNLAVAGHGGRPVTRMALAWNCWLTNAAGDGYAMSVSNDPYEPNERGWALALVVGLTAGMRIDAIDRAAGTTVLSDGRRQLTAWHNRAGWTDRRGERFTLSHLPAGTKVVEVYGYDGLRRTVAVADPQSVTLEGLPPEQTLMFLAAPEPTQLPAAPREVTGLAVSPTEVELRWSAGASPGGFRVERVWPADGARPDDWASRHVAGWARALRLLHLTPGVEYRFQVRATNGAGDSAPSGVVAVTTPPGPAACIPLRDEAYTQSFDTPQLSSVGPSSGSLPWGWRLRAYHGKDLPMTYRVNDGSSSQNFVGVQSYGAPGDPDRALGTHAGKEPNLELSFGAALSNATDRPLLGVEVAYVGEAWRANGVGRSDRLDFAFSTDATTLHDGTWSAVEALDFEGPAFAATGAVPGNEQAHRRALGPRAIRFPRPVAPGQWFWIRWQDRPVEGADDGLAVDDLTVKPLWQ